MANEGKRRKGKSTSPVPVPSVGVCTSCDRCGLDLLVCEGKVIAFMGIKCKDPRGHDPAGGGVFVRMV